jgi:threonine aldolase
MAMKLKKGFADKGYEFAMDSATNQQFIILNDEQFEKLSQIAVFELWERLGDGRTVVRFCTSWATREEDVDALLAQI